MRFPWEECLFGDIKTRGFNLEDTRLRDPRKRDPMIAITALATAWASKAAASVLGSATPKRKSHGYLGESWFRTGFDHIRHALDGKTVAVRPTQTDGAFDVYFRHHRVKTIDMTRSNA
jgi:hypothetical protein